MTMLWVRLDTNLPGHDKIVSLVLEDHSPHRWRAAFSYVCSIAWSASAGTDGRIPIGALTMVHATKQTADLLTKYHLWETDVAGYQIHNYANYQQVTRVTEEKRHQAQRAACARWHGLDCWGPDGCNRA